jgi:hypothetical protein
LSQPGEDSRSCLTPAGLRRSRYRGGHYVGWSQVPADCSPPRFGRGGPALPAARVARSVGAKEAGHPAGPDGEAHFVDRDRLAGLPAVDGEELQADRDRYLLLVLPSIMCTESRYRRSRASAAGAGGTVRRGEHTRPENVNHMVPGGRVLSRTTAA